MKSKVQKKSLLYCPVCRQRDIQITSASPGDGRKKYICKSCKHTWTNGKKNSEGYK